MALDVNGASHQAEMGHIISKLSWTHPSSKHCKGDKPPHMDLAVNLTSYSIPSM